jgi:hypothetical protein
MSTPVVAICIPSMSSMCTDTALSLIALVQRATNLGIKVITINYQCCVISHSRNQLVVKALAFDNPKVTHILWVDSDMTVPQTALERLLSHDKDVVGSFYSRRTFPHTTAGCLIGTHDVAKGGLYPASLMPHGCCLVKRKVYETIKGPWYFEHYDDAQICEGDDFGHVSEDSNFTTQCIKHGFEVFCDADLTFETGHIGSAIFSCDRPNSNSVPSKPTSDQK